MAHHEERVGARLQPLKVWKDGGRSQLLALLVALLLDLLLPLLLALMIPLLSQCVAAVPSCHKCWHWVCDVPGWRLWHAPA